MTIQVFWQPTLGLVLWQRNERFGFFNNVQDMMVSLSSMSMTLCHPHAVVPTVYWIQIWYTHARSMHNTSEYLFQKNSKIMEQRLQNSFTVPLSL
jgi:hypothetical protein